MSMSLFTPCDWLIVVYVVIGPICCCCCMDNRQYSSPGCFFVDSKWGTRDEQEHFTFHFCFHISMMIRKTTCTQIVIIVVVLPNIRIGNWNRSGATQTPLQQEQQHTTTTSASFSTTLYNYHLPLWLHCLHDVPLCQSHCDCRCRTHVVAVVPFRWWQWQRRHRLHRCCFLLLCCCFVIEIVRDRKLHNKNKKNSQIVSFFFATLVFLSTLRSNHVYQSVLVHCTVVPVLQIQVF